MFKRNKLHTALVVTSAALMSAAAVAETTSGTASVQITNAFSLVETTPLSFGNLQLTIDASSGTNGIIEITIAGDSSPMEVTTSTADEATANILTAGAPGVFDISGAAPFTQLNVTFPAEFELVNTAAPPTNPRLDVLLDETTTYIVGGTNDGLLLEPGTTEVITDGTGAVGLSLGGVLSSDTTDVGPYADGTYSGSFNLIVNY